MLGRQLLQTALSREGIPGDISDENGLCALTYGPYGKPFLRELPNIQFNISHTKGLVVCAIGTASLGIDAEKIRPYPGSVLRKMTEEERVYINYEAGLDDERSNDQTDRRRPGSICSCKMCSGKTIVRDDMPSDALAGSVCNNGY